MENKPIISLFEENELNISSLYSIYAEKIPGKSRFWKKIAAEEIDHAEEIRNQRDVLELNDTAESKFSRNIIDYVMGFVLDETEKAQQTKIGHRDAVLSALRIERSMLEKKLFDIFIPSNETVKNVMKKLNKETERHVQLLLDEMARNKFSF
jgi:rubrerythrin